MGAEAATIGRSRGGLTTRLHAAVDAIGLPIRIHPTPGRWGDRPQAEALLAGLEGVGHVIADTACDADPPRSFIADDLGATAHLKANPTDVDEVSFGSSRHGAAMRSCLLVPCGDVSMTRYLDTHGLDAIRMPDNLRHDGRQLVGRAMLHNSQSLRPDARAYSPPIRTRL